MSQLVGLHAERACAAATIRWRDGSSSSSSIEPRPLSARSPSRPRLFLFSFPSSSRSSPLSSSRSRFSSSSHLPSSPSTLPPRPFSSSIPSPSHHISPPLRASSPSAPGFDQPFDLPPSQLPAGADTSGGAGAHRDNDFGFTSRPMEKKPSHQDEMEKRLREVISMPWDVARRLWRLVREQPEEFRLVQFPSWKEMVSVTLLTFLFIVVLIIFLASVDSFLLSVLLKPKPA